MKSTQRYIGSLIGIPLAFSAGCAAIPSATYESPLPDNVVTASPFYDSTEDALTKDVDSQEQTEQGDVCRIVTGTDGLRTAQCALAPQENSTCGTSRENPCTATPPTEVCGTSRQNPCRVNHRG